MCTNGLRRHNASCGLRGSKLPRHPRVIQSQEPGTHHFLVLKVFIWMHIARTEHCAATQRH